MDENSQNKLDPVRSIEECSSINKILLSQKTVQSPIRSYSIQSFRNFILKEPHGKVLYKDVSVIRQIYDNITAIKNDYRDSEKQLFFEKLSEVKWSTRSDINFDYLIFLLSSIIQEKKSVSDLIHKINEEKDEKFNSSFIHPGMPIRVCGSIKRKSDVQKKEICLRMDDFSIRVLLTQGNNLYQEYSFLKERFLFVIGIIWNIEKIVSIKTGAILL